MSSSTAVDPKPPGAIKLYSRDWSGDLAVGDVIQSSVWSFSPNDVFETNKSITGYTTNVLISGGVEGQVYYVTNTIGTASGQTLYRTGELRVQTEGVDA